MFTGIIEKTLRVQAVADTPNFRRLTLPNPYTDVEPGESIAVNGVCLTVAELTPHEFGFDVISETLSKTNLGTLEAGDEVHVERSLRIGDRLDGHFVQGHVDGLGRLISQSDNDNEWRLRLAVSDELAKFLTPKGSITLDGVSLTLAAVDMNEFEVALIPTTLKMTTLGRRVVGALFNIECDVLAKTVVSWLENQRVGSTKFEIRGSQ